MEDAERNLGLWCLFYLARHIIGNESLGTGSRIVAHGEPCWEDAEYLNNWTFSAKDTEQETAWGERSFTLKPYELRDHEGAVYKRFKKLTKVRRTQKTSWAKALVTIRVLRAYFALGRPNYRVLVISGTSTLARDHYLEPLKEMWTSHATLQRLYGVTTKTPRYELLVRRAARGKHVEEFEFEGEKRDLVLLSRGGKGKDTLRCRWIVGRADSSGLSAISVKVAGMETTTSGNRWDLVIVDDPVVPENVTSEPLRKKVKRKIADLRKQGDADSEFVYLNTPYHIDDASAQIDAQQGHQYHIMYRPAMWFDNATKAPIYYWQYNALDPGEPVKGQPPRNAVWTAEQIEDERDQPDFHSQVLLQPRDEANALFDERDFSIVDIEDCPPEVRAGLYGRLITQEETDCLNAMAADGFEFHSYLFIDPASNEAGGRGIAETAAIGAKTARDGIYYTYMRAGHMSATEEENTIYDGWQQTGAEIVHYETSVASKKIVKKNFSRFQLEKSREIGHAVIIPFSFRDAQTTKSKEIRVPLMQPLAKGGRIKIVRQAAPAHVIRKFIGQFTDWGQATLKDMADAASMIQYYTRVEQYEAMVEEERKEKERFGIDDDGTVHIPPGFIAGQIAAFHSEAVLPWGKRGVSRG